VKGHLWMIFKPLERFLNLNIHPQKHLIENYTYLNNSRTLIKNSFCKFANEKFILNLYESNISIDNITLLRYYKYSRRCIRPEKTKE